MSIKTYHEMNEVIKDLLSRSDEQFDEYVLTRIIELEQQNKRYREALKEIVDSTMAIKDYKEHSFHAERVAIKALEGEE